VQQAAGAQLWFDLDPFAHAASRRGASTGPIQRKGGVLEEGQGVMNEAWIAVLAVIPTSSAAIAWAIASVRRVRHAARQDSEARQAFVTAVEILALRAPEHVPDALHEIFNGRPAVREDRFIEMKPTRSPARNAGAAGTTNANPAAAIDLPQRSTSLA